MSNNEICIKATLVAKKSGNYIVYVFQNCDDIAEYVMCTRCPNWDGPDINIGQKGFLRYKFVRAGEDTWFNESRKTFEPYMYTADRKSVV